MTINYQFGDVDTHGALIRAQAASLEAEHQAIIRDVLAAGDFGAARDRRPASSSSPRWAATSRSSTNKPTPTGRRCKPPATTWPAPTPPWVPAGPNQATPNPPAACSCRPRRSPRDHTHTSALPRAVSAGRAWIDIGDGP